MLEIMTQTPSELFSTGQIRLAELSVYNWGSFNELHTARIDPEGTLITGDNGAGKSTLIDGLMALLLPSSKASFNIAAAQGDRTDRTLMTYIRGNYGKAHDGSETSTLLKRSGATATALRALYVADDGSRITLAALFWITQTSNALNDLKRLYIVGKKDIRLESLLHMFGEANARALKQHLKEDPLVSTFDSFTEYQETYTRILRMENSNAPALLSRALGLKKIDDLTSLIRDLVLEPSQVKDDAKKVVSEFEDLVGIHDELENAKKQRDALFELPGIAESLKQARDELFALESESTGLSAYFGEQCYRLWGVRLDELRAELQEITNQLATLVEEEERSENRVQELYHAYQSKGGDRLEVLRRDLEDAKKARLAALTAAGNYQKDAKELGLPDTLNFDGFKQNQNKAISMVEDLPDQREQVQNLFVAAASEHNDTEKRLKVLEDEIRVIEARPDSNIDPRFQRLRDEMVDTLGLDKAQVMFIGELLDVADEYRVWQGAIERALGGHRTTLLVPEAGFGLATKWLNSRHTGLHVRVQVVRPLEQKADFLGDGFLRKLTWREHVYRDWLKKHLTRFDLHCVESTEVLDQTPFSITQQGLMHLEKGRFEKKDQQRVDDPRHWSLGFSNKSRLSLLKGDSANLSEALGLMSGKVKLAREALAALESKFQVWRRVVEYSWDSIDVEKQQGRVNQLKDDLSALERPDSDLGEAKSRWEQAKLEYSLVKDARNGASQALGRKEGDIEKAQSQQVLAFAASQAGLSDVAREALSKRVGLLNIEDLELAAQIEKRHRKDVDDAKSAAQEKKTRAIGRATGTIARFREHWPLVANDWGTSADSLDEYVAHLEHLESEGLPGLVEKFRERLNRNATQSLAHIRQGIEAEREDIRDRIGTINEVLERTEFKQNTYLRLGSKPEVFEHVKAFNSQLVRVLARAGSDDHEERFQELKEIVERLEKATNPATSGNLESLRLLDSRYQMTFYAEEVEKVTGIIRDVLESSSGKSGGEKESFAGTIVAASLAYVLTPDGYDRPLYCTVFLDEAFSNTAEAVSRRVLKVFRELKIHVNLITPYKNLNLARESARSLLIAERDQGRHESRLCEVTWEEIDQQLAEYEQRRHQALVREHGITVEAV